MRLPILASVLCLVICGPGSAATAPHKHKPTRTPTRTTTVTGPPPVMPAAPPAAAVIAPPDLTPPHLTPPPPPPPVHSDAPGDTSKIPDGLRLTFGADRADFNPATQAALLILAHTGLGSPIVVYNLYAHAQGSPEDTSSPRRLSLERALAVRSALINAGIASTRIYVHAMGANGTDTGAPADRVDVTLANLDTTPPAIPAPPPATSQPVTPQPGTP